ncbi:MAG: hypothetical protein V7720_01530 [Halioglobus sp.]
MMDPDKELSLLEEEFPRSHRAWIRDTPADLDERILSLAARHAPYLEASYLLKDEQAKLKSIMAEDGRLTPEMGPLKGRRPKPRMPPKPSVRYSVDYNVMADASMKRPSQKRTAVPPGAKKLLMSLENAEQQQWLDTIADIVRGGDIELATYLLRRYRRTFHSI